jgi:hypothetical protein
MKKINPIFVSMALVVATLLFCGKKMKFLLYTLLGRIIIVLFILGLTIVNKYAGIVATLIVSALYYHNDYKEGFTEGVDDDDDDDDDDDEDDEDYIHINPGSAVTPAGGDISSSSASFPSDANPPDEPLPIIEPPSTTPIESSSTTFNESS